VIIRVEVDTMATNLSLDPELLEKALEVSGEKTKKAAVTKALKRSS
jgi:Arc/MetJ family transcription regulator